MDSPPPPPKPVAVDADNPGVKSPLPMPSRAANAERLVRVTIGGTSRDWWNALQASRDAGTMPPALEPLASGAEGELSLTQPEWRAVFAWAQALPGWVESDGSQQLVAEDPIP